MRVGVVSWKRLSRFEVVFLDSSNISVHIDTTYPRNLWSSTVTTRSDIIRLKLLYKYGGLWMDASTFINGPLDFLNEHRTSIFMFREESFLHNWFIYCPQPMHPMIGTWLHALASWVDQPYAFEHPCTPWSNYTVAYEVLCFLNRTNDTVSRTIASDIIMGDPLGGSFYNPFLPLSLNGDKNYNRLVKFTHSDQARYWRGFPISELLVFSTVVTLLVILYALAKPVKRAARYLHASVPTYGASWISLQTHSAIAR